MKQNQQADQSSNLNKQIVCNKNVSLFGHVDSGRSALLSAFLNHGKAPQPPKDHFFNEALFTQRVDSRNQWYSCPSFIYKKSKFTVLNVKRYIPNLTMPIHQADIILLVVSALKGEFQCGFEKEGLIKNYAKITKTMRVAQVVIVVTKMGLIQWNEERFSYIKEKVSSYLQEDCELNIKHVIPIDSLLDQNIHEKIEGLWYNGPCLLDYLDTINSSERNPSGLFRLSISDRWKVSCGACVEGKIISGSIAINQKIAIMPQGVSTLVKRIETNSSENQCIAYAGDNVRLYLSGINEQALTIGNVICSLQTPCIISTEIKTNITIFGYQQKCKIVIDGFQCQMRLHSSISLVTIDKIVAKHDKINNKKLVAKYLKAGQSGICIFKFDQLVSLEKQENMPSLGRFVLELQDTEIGCGQIIGIKPIAVEIKDVQQIVKPKEASQLSCKANLCDIRQQNEEMEYL